MVVIFLSICCTAEALSYKIKNAVVIYTWLKGLLQTAAQSSKVQTDLRNR